jgi:hypothetical protein
MSCMQYLGQGWPELVERVERCGSWPVWVAAEPALATVGGIEAVASTVANRADSQRADEVLAALVRLGALDGGDDLDAAWAVALLLANGAGALVRQLRSMSPSIDAMVAGQVWLQIRQFPSRRRRRAIAANILMDARRALLRDLGADTRTCSRGVTVILVDTNTVAVDSGGGLPALGGRDLCQEPADEPTLNEVVDWGIRNGVVRADDASTLVELAAVEVLGAVRGLNSAAEIHVVATRRGVSDKTVVRSRDRALRSLIAARQSFLRDCA